MLKRFLLFCAGAGFAAFAMAGVAQAQFYKGKTVTVLINSGAGGNSDLIARLFINQ